MSLAERQVAVIALASGRFKDVSLPPSWAQQRVQFDTWLSSPPAPVVVLDVEERELRQVLGVR